MDVVAYSLTTLAKVKNLLGITDTSSDTLLEDMINSATDFIENFCARRFKETTHTEELLSGAGTTGLFVKYFPIINFTKLELRTSKTTWEDVDSDDYIIDEDTGEIRFYEKNAKGFLNYRGTYDAGFATIPYDLDQACQQMVAHEFNTRGQGGEVASESLGEYSVSYKTGGGSENDKFIDSVLFRYKKQKI